jgi:hypothetical protein
VTLSDEDFDVRQVDGVLPLVLDDGPHRVLEELEKDVLQVGRGVHDLDRRTDGEIVVNLKLKRTQLDGSGSS